jgi:hypothetical protein
VGPAAAGSDLIELQSLAGNRAVTELVQGASVQREDADAEARPDYRVTEAINAAVSLAQADRTVLLPDDVRDALEGREGDAELAAEFDRVVEGLDLAIAEQGELALEKAGGDLIVILENRFIFDKKASTIDLLGERRGGKYRGMAWEDTDFPEGTTGPNEAEAKELIGAMRRIRPERRVNIRKQKVLGKKELTKDLATRIQGSFVPVEGQPGKLHPKAASEFKKLADAAAADGVKLRICAASRSFEKAKKRAEAAGNNFAIADFSGHSLGLAVDLCLSSQGRRFAETWTGFTNVVAGHESLIHKWMFLKGAAHGWFPYSHEPWHWEYNPPGFRDEYRASIGLEPDPEAEDPGGGLVSAPEAIEGEEAPKAE